MTAKPGRFTARVLATAVTLSGIIACSPQETTVTPVSKAIPVSNEPTTFNCKPYQGS